MRQLPNWAPGLILASPIQWSVGHNLVVHWIHLKTHILLVIRSHTQRFYLTGLGCGLIMRDLNNLNNFFNVKC